MGHNHGSSKVYFRITQRHTSVHGIIARKSFSTGRVMTMSNCALSGPAYFAVHYKNIYKVPLTILLVCTLLLSLILSFLCIFCSPVGYNNKLFINATKHYQRTATTKQRPVVSKAPFSENLQSIESKPTDLRNVKSYISVRFIPPFPSVEAKLDPSLVVPRTDSKTT